MNSERRYSDDEVDEILSRATEARETPERRLGNPTRGLTLPELTEIGREVGIPDERIHAAARDLERTSGQARDARFMGVRVGVGRTVELERAPTQEEWQRFVLDLRETFQARGKLSDAAGLREWSNGNLSALVAPGPEGARLSLSTRKTSAREMMVGSLGTALFLGGMAVFNPAEAGAMAWSLAVVLAVVVWAFFGTGRWADTREAQMEELGARLASAMREPPALGPGGAEGPPVIPGGGAG